MKEYAFSLNLKDDSRAIEAYKEYHANVWPEVIRSFKAVGITDMKIFLLDRRMFMYMVTKDDFDPDVDFPRYLTLDPKCREWEDLMGTFQEKLPEAQPHEKWVRMEKVFQL
jgi:L-rhamnose mutarotase